MISGHSQIKRSKNWQKWHRISYNSMKNRGSTQILTNLVGVFPRNFHKILSKSVHCFKRSQKWGMTYSNTL